MSLGWLLEILLALSLNTWVVIAVLKRSKDRFFAVIAFSLTQIIAILVRTGVQFRFSPHSQQYLYTYWTSDIAGHAVISLLIFSLIWGALGTNRFRLHITSGLAIALLAEAVISAHTLYSPRLNTWMTSLSRNSSFAEEALNMLLWVLLLQRETFDPRLLLVSAGIGIQVSGEVIGHTLRLYTKSPDLVWVPTLLVSISELLCLLTWIWAFWSRETGRKPAASSPPERIALPAALHPLH